MNGNGRHNGGSEVLATARRFVECGCSILPIRLDGTKRPALKEWTWLQVRRPTSDELEELFGRQPVGIATICGRVSDDLEIIDLDNGALIEAFEKAVEAESPGLIERLCTDETPREGGGRQYKYRCHEVTIPGNQKLAQSEPERIFGEDGRPVNDPSTGKQKTAPRTLIETRGVGGYAVAPGSPLAVHKTGRPYRHLRGPSLTELPVITAAERNVLFRVARSFNRFVADYAPQGGERPAGQRTGLAPGDDFNQGAAWPEILEPHGWKQCGTRGGVTYWTRPGKSPADGHSATTGLQSKAGNDLLCVFSTNAYPFQIPAGKICESFSRFAAYTLLNHSGDFSEAAKALAKQGNGGRASATAARGQTELHQYTVGAVTLIPSAPRQTPAKLSVQLKIVVDGQPVDFLTLSDANSNRAAAVNAIRPHVGSEIANPDAEIRRALATILIAAAAALEVQRARAGADDRECVRDIIKRIVPGQIDLLYMTDKGNAFSRTLARDVSKSQFVDRFANNDLLGLAQTAADAPLLASGCINRPALISLLEKELRLLWGDLTKDLPSQPEAPIGEDSVAAQQFRAAVIRLWTKPFSMAIYKTPIPEGPVGGSVQVAARTSLVTRLRKMQAEAIARDGKRIPTSAFLTRWFVIQEGFAAWYREAMVKDEIVPLLAMRWQLFDQIGGKVEGVIDQKSLRHLGTKYGVFDRDPPVPTHVCVGEDRGFAAAVLSPDVIQELIFDLTVIPDELPNEEQTGGVVWGAKHVHLPRSNNEQSEPGSRGDGESD